jgi:hypothetical protein
MTISDQQAIGFGALAMIAEDMYAPDGTLSPDALAQAKHRLALKIHKL